MSKSITTEKDDEQSKDQMDEADDARLDNTAGGGVNYPNIEQHRAK